MFSYYICREYEDEECMRPGDGILYRLKIGIVKYLCKNNDKRFCESVSLVLY